MAAVREAVFELEVKKPHFMRSKSRGAPVIARSNEVTQGGERREVLLNCGGTTFFVRDRLSVALFIYKNYIITRRNGYEC